MFQEIAIVGISGKFPLADDLEAFHQNLLAKRDCIIEVPDRRRELLRLDRDKQYIQVGYLEGIEYFDNLFFGIYKKEAELMSPEQKLGLELAAQAIMDAGYPLEEFRGKNCAVIVSNSENEYKMIVGSKNSMAFLGNLQSMAAGKISYYLDLRGTNLTLDSSCSSTLLAIHEGCMKLNTEEADYALVGGMTVNMVIPEVGDEDYDGLGIMSSNGKSKSFSDRAEGAGSGEGGGFILMRRLEDAVRDGDPIYGVVCASAANSDGSRGSNVVAPSVAGQKEVIERAWKAGKIDPRQITELEAHGTGTAIGDPIEAQAVTEAFAGYTEEKAFVDLGAVKSNIGHLLYTAGIASMLKTLLGFTHAVGYPIVHYERPNPLIHFEETPLVPLAPEAKHWEKNAKRMAGISSFGFSGTNVHMVVRNWVREETTPAQLQPHNRFVKLSAKSKTALVRTAQRLACGLEDSAVNINDAVYTLNRGRDDFDYRAMLSISGKEDLVRQLRGLEETDCVKCDGQPQLAVVIRQTRKEAAEEELRMKSRVLEFLGDLGIKIKYMVSDDFGKLAQALAKGETDWDTAKARLSGLPAEKPDALQAEQAAIRKIAEAPGVFLIPLGGACEIPDTLKTLSPAHAGDLPAVAAGLYRAGFGFDWQSYYAGAEEKRISLPGYAFDPIENWIYPQTAPEAEPVSESGEHKNTPVPQESRESFQKALNEMWREVLVLDSLEDDESFFDVGGNSLLGMTLVDEIEERWNIAFDFDELYDYDTVDKLSDYLFEQLPHGEARKAAGQDPEPQESGIAQEEREFPVTPAQKVIMLTTMNRPYDSTFNLPMLLKVAGNLDTDRLARVFDRIVAENDNFRSVFIREGDGGFQRILDRGPRLEVKDALGETEAQREAYVQSQVETDANTPYDLSTAPPVKIELWKTGPDSYYLYFCIHHVIADGITLSFIVRDINRYYNQPEMLDTPLKKAKQIGDFVKWKWDYMASEKGRESYKFWEKELSGLKMAEPVLPDKIETYPEIFGDYVAFLLQEDTIHRANSLVKQERSSLFTITLAVYHLFVYALTGEKDNFLFLATATRTSPEIKDIYGNLVDLLHSRGTIDENVTVREYLRAVNERTRRFMEHQDYGWLEIMQKMLGSTETTMDSYSKFGMAFQNYKSENLYLGDAVLSSCQIDIKGCFSDVFIQFTLMNDTLVSVITYNNRVYKKETVQRFADKFKQIFEELVQNPEKRIGGLSALANETGSP